MAEPAGARRKGWTQDPDAVRRDILLVARQEFAAHGLNGARVDAIAARTSTSKRMIYYYFGDKLGLYRAVLEQAYAGIRKREQDMDLKGLSPVEAIRMLTGLTFDHHRENPDFVRLVLIENIHNAQHLRTSDRIAPLNHSAIGVIAGIYSLGVEQGVFRKGLDPLDIHLTISALAFFNVANQATVAHIFSHDMAEPALAAERRRSVIDAVERFVRV